MGTELSAVVIVTYGPAATSTLPLRRSRNKSNHSATSLPSSAQNPPQRPTCLNTSKLCLRSPSPAPQFAQPCPPRRAKVSKNGCRRPCQKNVDPTQYGLLPGISTEVLKGSLDGVNLPIKLRWNSSWQKMIKPNNKNRGKGICTEKCKCHF